MIRPTLAFALLALVLGASPAMAAPKIALTTIDNDSGGDVRDAVVDALDGKDLTLVSEKETNRAVDKLKGELADLTEKQAKKLATELEADAIVHGTLDKQGGSKVLKFKLFVNGRKMKGFSVTFTNPRTKKFKAALHDKMVEKVTSPPAEEPVADEKPIKKKPVEEDTEDPNPKKKKSKKDKTVADKSVDEKPTEDGEETPKPKKAKKTAKVDEDEEEEATPIEIRAQGSPHSANRVAVRLDVGGSFAARRLQFTTTAELAASGQAPKTFKPGPVPGARFEVETYPLAFMNPKSFAAGLGVGVEFDKVLSSKVQTNGGAEPGKSMTVKQQQYSLGARYRLLFGKTATSPSVTVGINYGRRTFKVQSKGILDNRGSLDLPDTDYKYLSPLLGFRVPFTRNIAMIANAEALLVSDAGPIQEASSYGRAKIFGFDSQAGFDVVLGNRFAIRFVGEFSQIGFTFTGGGELAKNRDMDPDTIDIGGASDRVFGGSATVAVLY